MFRALVALALSSFASPAFSQADDAMLPKMCLERRAKVLETYERTLPTPSPAQFAKFEMHLRYSIAVMDTGCIRDACRADVRECGKVHLLEDIERKLRDELPSLRR